MPKRLATAGSTRRKLKTAQHRAVLNLCLLYEVGEPPFQVLRILVGIIDHQNGGEEKHIQAEDLPEVVADDAVLFAVRGVAANWSRMAASNRCRGSGNSGGWARGMLVIFAFILFRHAPIIPIFFS